MSRATDYLLAGLIAVSLIIGSAGIYLHYADDPDGDMASLVAGVMPSVVEVICTDGTERAEGTGFIMNDRGVLVVTNAHVINSGTEEAPVIYTSIFVQFAIQSGLFDMTVEGFDTSIDVAVLRFVSPPPVASLNLGNSSDTVYGQSVFTIGNALGFGLSVTNGIISVPLVMMITQDITRTMVQTNIIINSGNSGGPLFNTDGNVIGMMTFTITVEGEEIDGMSFAVPSNTISAFVASLP